MDKNFKRGGNLANLTAETEQTKIVQPQQDIRYPNPPQGLDEQISALPNSEKLSGFERWVYKKLPGVSESSVGKMLETFSKTPVGRALNYLDIPAEGVERTFGLASQLMNLKEGEGLDIKDAWNAGSLFYDTANLPEFRDGGVFMQDEMPGNYALVEARKLLAQGATLEEVRDKLYNNLGALRIRGQLRDTYGHIGLDPLNFIGAFLKPVSKLTAMRNLALAGKVDVAQAAKIANDLRLAGKIDDAVKVENAVADAKKLGKALTRTDKAIINLFGGANYLEDQGKLGKVFGSKYNPMALTPEAKAYEMIDMAEKNTTAYLINNSKTPDDFIRNMESFAKGSVGGEWGSIALTPQGRVVQGFFNHADASIKAHGAEWKLYKEERAAAEMLASALGSDVRKIHKIAKENPTALLKQISEAQAAGKIAAFDPKVVDAIASIPNGSVDTMGWMAKAAALVEDSAARIAIAKFGVEEKKFITHLSDAVKKYETLAFIKINPGNTTRNYINNKITLIGRGLHGIHTKNWYNDFWEGKYIPAMLKRGFNVAGEGIEHEFDTASKLISKTLEGNNPSSFLGKAGSLADDFKLGKVDLSELSKKAEAGASLRASTNAYIEFGNQYWNPKTGFTSISKYLDPNIVDQINAIDPNLARTLDDIAEAANGDARKFKELLGTDLEINSASVIKATEENLGFKLNDVLGPELTETFRQGLPKAMKEGKVKEFVEDLRTQMEAHTDEMFEKHLENLPGIVSSYVQAGGPTQFSRIFSKAMNEMWAGNTEHAIRMSTINELLDYARQTGNYKKVGEFWGKILEDGRDHFARVWKKMDAYEKGMKEGAKLAGLPYPKEISEGFSGLKKGWGDFFEFRDKEYKAFFDAQNSGQQATKTYEQVVGEIDKKFRAMVSKEDNLYSKIDDALADMIPDKEMRKMYTRFRDEVAKLRENDRKLTELFYQELRAADPGEQPNLWQKYWQERMQRIQQIREMEYRGSAALQGDAQAIQQFAAGSSSTADANTVQGLASQYGIATQTNNGVRMDNRLRNTLKKYGDFSDEDIINSAKLPDEVKSAFLEYKKVEDNLDYITNETSGILTPEAADLLKQAKAAEKAARKTYEDVLTANHVDKKLINKLLKSKEPMDINKLPLEKVKAAFEKRAAEKAVAPKKAVDKSFIPDAEKMWPELPPIETAISELNYGRSFAVMDNIVEEALGQAQVKAHKLSDLPEALQKKVMSWADNVNAESTAFESARFEYAKMRRDSALLDYRRRNNFDNLLGHIAPFAFWTTHSMANWAIHSIDRPAMLTSYMRYQKLLETAGLENDNLPNRMKGHLRVGLPFAPDWIGEQFFNPVGVALPFDAWQQPWEQMEANRFSIENRAEHTLDDMLEKGVITEQEYRQAKEQRDGATWDLAVSKASEGGENYDAMDFAQAMMTPHAPLLWAFNAARGTPNDIGPLMPMSRTAKNVASMLGVDWNNAPYNLEGRMRKQLGLPAYDKWDNYRVAREISNFAGDGRYSLEQIRDAMVLQAQVEAGQITSKEAVAQSEVYKDATIKAGQEFAGGAAGTVLGALGIPVKSLPTGEQEQRKLQDEFVKAIQAKEKGNEDALKDFFDEHPEYESRLALFKKPEERLKNFMVDNMWQRWNELPKVQQDEIKEQLGDSFSDKFLNKETRNYDGITPQQLQLWLKLTGGKQVGKLSATEEALTELSQLELTDPETAFRVQTFYNMREEEFPGWYEAQNDYYALPEKGNSRDKFKRENPMLNEYWTARRQWMEQNPDLVRFLTDDPKQLKKYENKRRNPEVAVPTAEEISRSLSPANIELIGQWSEGQTLPISTERLLDMLSEQYGIPKRDLLGILTGK